MNASMRMRSPAAYDAVFGTGRKKTVYVDLDTEAQVEGRRKPETCMMVKQLGKQTFPQDCLFIREEL